MGSTRAGATADVRNKVSWGGGGRVRSRRARGLEPRGPLNSRGPRNGATTDTSAVINHFSYSQLIAKISDLNFRLGSKQTGGKPVGIVSRFERIGVRRKA